MHKREEVDAAAKAAEQTHKRVAVVILWDNEDGNVDGLVVRKPNAQEYNQHANRKTSVVVAAVGGDGGNFTADDANYAAKLCVFPAPGEVNALLDEYPGAVKRVIAAADYLAGGRKAAQGF